MTIADDDELSAMKQAYVRTAFLAPADHNYLMARIAFKKGLVLDAYWSAAQAVEKYFKASLLLNGRSAADNGHDLLELNRIHAAIEGMWMPKEFQAPTRRSPAVASWLEWGDNTVAGFLSMLAVYGSTDARYGRNGYVVDHFVAPKLDQLVFVLRRTCRNVAAFDLEADPMDWKLDSLLPLESHLEERPHHGEAHNELVRDFLDGNAIWQAAMSGGGAEMSLRPMQAYQAGAYAAAIMRVLPESTELLIEFNDWVLSSVKLNASDRKDLLAENRRLAGGAG